MVEQIRDVKITIVIDTNKATYERSFDTMDKAMSWYSTMMVSI